MEVWAASEIWLGLLPLYISAHQNHFPELICTAGPGSCVRKGCAYGGGWDFVFWQQSDFMTV